MISFAWRTIALIIALRRVVLLAIVVILAAQTLTTTQVWAVVAALALICDFAGEH